MIGRRGKTSKLAAIRNQKCARCPLHMSSENVCVMGRGNAMGRILLLGEAPGAAEAETGKPFMGRAGQLLNMYLRKLDMEDMIYITNAAKCRPPDNRTPKTDEIKKCGSYLKRELKVIDPYVIVAMGLTANSALGCDGWAWPRGTPVYHVKMNRIVIHTWHPAYCLRQGTKVRREFSRHLLTARNCITNKTVPCGFNTPDGRHPDGEIRTTIDTTTLGDIPF